MSTDEHRRRPVFSKTAQKGIADLPEHIRKACGAIIRELATGTVRGKPLKGDLSDLRSVRLGRTHRLLYRETEQEILVVDVGPRGYIYKR